MATTSDIRNGLCIEFNHGLWQVVQFQHVKPGKGAAFVRTKLKNLETGKVLENTFPAGSKIEPVRIENRKYQYLYNDDMGFHFMNTDTYEQIALMRELINAPDLLKDGQQVNILFHAEKEQPLLCDLPAAVVLEVSWTEPGVKGDTATNTMKPAKLETGAEIQVPLFINEGDFVKVTTEDGKYSERVKI
jgi:elongation factor P